MTSDTESRDACCNIWSTFNLDNTLAEYAYWRVLISPRAYTLGNCVLVLKRHIATFAVVTPLEWVEYGKIVGGLERALIKAFACDRVNYIALMMVDRHVHTHVIPRYASSRVFAGTEWKDEGWPYPPQLQAKTVEPETLNSICDTLRNNLH